MKNQKGAISIFVLLSMLFLLAIIVGIYTINSKRVQTQIESVELVKDKYYVEGEENIILDERVSKQTKNIPIYTKEQLWTMGTGKSVEIEGVIYTFAEDATYELQNDIVLNLDTDMEQTFDDSNLKLNNYEIYYYDSGTNDYYDLISGTEYDLEKDGEYYSKRIS